MEPVASNIQVLLQAAEFLERREREAEHGYASLCPLRSPGPVYRRRKRSPQASGAPDSGRRAQLKRCLEQLKQQMPLGADCARYTTLSLLRWARMHIQKLEEQEQQARRLKEKLRSEQQSLRRQLERLRGLAGPGERERPRADSLDSSGLSSERSDSDQGEWPEAKGLRGRSGPGLLTGPLPAQRRWRWTWRAWCSGARLSCCGASVRARSTATHTAAAPGYDLHRPGAGLRPQTALGSEPGAPQASRAAWNGLKGPLHRNRCLPPTMTLAAGSPSWGGVPGFPLSPAGQAAWAWATLPGHFCSTWLCRPQGAGSLLGPHVPS
ncbi:max dimerization protein 3 isoform X2 [Ursus americanus]|uniref:max dimerization protein 3 isoform X2 n=1 Tax=Ursus americanus TaxID=9643 RepID=UPI001E67998E|nr:max dimerization protein 3 isoform X2 [Ursus americanus]